MGTLPTRGLLGVERVVVVCDADSSLTSAEARAICDQLVQRAQKATELPVIGAAQSDLESSNVRQGDQLVLHVALSAKALADGRGTLAMTVTPSRNELKLNQGAPVHSEAQLARIQGRPVVQGPIDAFNKLLGSGPRDLRKPIRSDN